MKLTKRLTALALAALMALSLAACGDNGGTTNDGGEATVVENGTYTTLYAGEVTTLNYLITGNTNELSISYNVVDCLVEYDSLGNVQPALALEWSSNEDATVWTFTLREGVKWVDCNGNEVAEVTAHDWVSSAHYVCDAAHDSNTFYTYSGIIAGADAYYDYTAYLMELEHAVDGTDDAGNPVKLVEDDGEWVVLEEVPAATLDDIGVKALDDHTLQFTLESPRPYFVSMISFGPYMPVYGPFLEEQGDSFGLATDASTLLYCGAYILSDFQPQVSRTLTRNASYWDVEKVYIETVKMIYNAEASSIATTMYLSGEVDNASVPADLLSAYMDDSKTADLIHPSRADVSYSYFYLFNFDANFDDEYEPENWTIAVNNENFRLAVTHALNRLAALSVYDSIDPASLLNNTITPAGFSSASADFTSYGDLAAYTAGDSYNTELALQYKEKAVSELTAAGATFPVKVLMRYNPGTTNWASECQVVEQQLESVLGTDFIDVIVVAGPETGFLGAVRRTGDYALMKCNWGADYADPETWTDPFSATSSYSFIYESEDPTTQTLYNQYLSLVAAAKAITDDMDARYEAFAAAESFLLDHGFAIPFSISARTYQFSNLNLFESQYASFGGANLRYKGMHLYTSSMSLEDYQTAYAEWIAARSAN